MSQNRRRSAENMTLEVLHVTTVKSYFHTSECVYWNCTVDSFAHISFCTWGSWTYCIGSVRVSKTKQGDNSQMGSFQVVGQSLSRGCVYVCLRSTPDRYGEEKKEIVLVIKNFLPADLQREFNCSAKNEHGLSTRRVHLTEEGKRQDLNWKFLEFFFPLLFSLFDLVLCLVARLPWVELGCGLGATLLVALLLFLMYHFFWLELLLLYRSWFGIDEQLLGRSYPLTTPCTGRSVVVEILLIWLLVCVSVCLCVHVSVCVCMCRRQGLRCVHLLFKEQCWWGLCVVDIAQRLGDTTGIHSVYLWPGQLARWQWVQTKTNSLTYCLAHSLSVTQANSLTFWLTFSLSLSLLNIFHHLYSLNVFTCRA